LKSNNKGLKKGSDHNISTRQKNWVVDLSNKALGYFLWISSLKTLDKVVSDFYIYLEIGERFFNQVLLALNKSVNKNTKIPFGKTILNVNLSSKKCIAYEKQLLV
jgi:hypothetical protein